MQRIPCNYSQREAGRVSGLLLYLAGADLPDFHAFNHCTQGINSQCNCHLLQVLIQYETELLAVDFAGSTQSVTKFYILEGCTEIKHTGLLHFPDVYVHSELHNINLLNVTLSLISQTLKNGCSQFKSCSYCHVSLSHVMVLTLNSIMKEFQPHARTHHVVIIEM